MKELKNKSKIRVAAYIRVAKKDQINAEIIMQKNAIDSYIEMKEEMEIVDYYIDNGYSGINFNRPMFQKMIKDVQDRKLNAIIVKDISRLSRSLNDFRKCINKNLKPYDVKLISVKDDIEQIYSQYLLKNGKEVK